jgi:hypothetical protein
MFLVISLYFAQTSSTENNYIILVILFCFGLCAMTTALLSTAVYKNTGDYIQCETSHFIFNEVHFRQLYTLKLACSHLLYFRQEQLGTQMFLHLPSTHPSSSFCSYCNSLVLVSGLEYGCTECPDNGSNLIHDAMPTGQHRLTWSSLR